MKSDIKSKSKNCKKNLILTANVAEVLKKEGKKTIWKNKTSKLVKTIIGKTLAEKPNLMTEDDIEKLFNDPFKSKQVTRVPTKLSIELDELIPNAERKDYVSSVKFLRVDDEIDKLLSGLYLYNQFNGNIFCQSFVNCETEDLTTNFKKNYLVGKVIGEGAYANVRIAIFKPKQMKVALKIYQKIKIKDYQRKKSVRRQIQILQLLDHPNIVKIHDVVETNNHLNISMQYLSGLSLGTYLKAQPHRRIPEKICKKIFKELTKALAYMHEINIAHRDMKLENIILDENLCPKIIDFGFSTCIEPNQKNKLYCGTPSYMAPQVVQRTQYRGETADVWALGVLLFVSLTGIFPFKGATDQELFKKISESDYCKSELMFTKTGSDIISKMLKVNVDERITAQQILNHSWFHECKADSSKKKQIDHSQETKRATTANKNDTTKLKIKQNKAQNSAKKFLAETCKQNLRLQLRAFRSPKNNDIHSFRKKKEDKENNNMKLSLKNDKISSILRQTFVKESARQNEALGKKQKVKKGQHKFLEYLRFELKKRQEERSKSKSHTHRN